MLVKYTAEVGIELVRRQGYACPSAAARNPGEAYVDAVSVRYVPEDSIRNGQFLQRQVELLWPREPFSEADLQLFARRNARIFSRALPGPALNLVKRSNGKLFNLSSSGTGELGNYTCCVLAINGKLIRDNRPAAVNRRPKLGSPALSVLGV